MAGGADGSPAPARPSGAGTRAGAGRPRRGVGWRGSPASLLDEFAHAGIRLPSLVTRSTEKRPAREVLGAVGVIVSSGWFGRTMAMPWLAVIELGWAGASGPA